jgi:L-ascorbate metabolism protein UlaG (beta-lactamase superfamily)
MPEFTSESDNKIRYTWIGHSTAVINIANKVNILIDPVFKDRCSPFKNYGPKRYRETPCKIGELPHIDIVLVSHDHYDHLEDYALSELESLFQPEFFAGLESGKIFPKNCKMNEMDWTETKKITVNGLEL